MSLSDSYFPPRLKIYCKNIEPGSSISPHFDHPLPSSSITSNIRVTEGKRRKDQISKAIKDIALLLKEDTQEIEAFLPSILIILSSIEEPLENENSFDSQQTLETPFIPLEHQVEAVFLKALSELYDEDIPQSIKLLDEILIYGIKSPRLAPIYQVIFSMLSSNFNNPRTDGITHHSALSSPPQISLKSSISVSPKRSITVEDPNLDQVEIPLKREKYSPERVAAFQKPNKRGKQSRDRRYSCSECEKTFDRPSALASHRKTHSQLREFTCTLCSSAFKFKHDMERHLRRHTGDKPYPCSHCDQVFYRSDTMTNHMKTKHPDVSAPSY